MDIELSLYFEPQKYFYLGLSISGAVFIGLFGYLMYDWRRRVVEKVKNSSIIK